MIRGSFLFVVVVAGSACIPEGLRTIEIPTESEVEVPGTGVGLTNPLAPDDVFPSDAISEALAQSMSQSFATNEIDKDAVDSLKLTTLKATVTEPNEGNTQVRDLGFLKKATFFVGGPEGADEEKVAESKDGDFDTDPAPTAYDFPLTGNELVRVFKDSDALTMRADIEPDERPQFATTVRFDVVLTVVVNPVGALNGGP